MQDLIHRSFIDVLLNVLLLQLNVVATFLSSSRGGNYKPKKIQFYSFIFFIISFCLIKRHIFSKLYFIYLRHCSLWIIMYKQRDGIQSLALDFLEDGLGINSRRRRRLALGLPRVCSCSLMQQIRGEREPHVTDGLIYSPN